MFTSGATGALKLLAELFPWSSHSELRYTVDNHTSVLGMRNVAIGKGATVRAVSGSECFQHCELVQASGHHEKYCTSSSATAGGQGALIAHAAPPQAATAATPPPPPPTATTTTTATSPPARATHHCLFAFPGESNFSGAKYDLSVVSSCHSACGTFAAPADAKWWVVLDAAKFAATSPLDLHTYKPDFVCLSFYKLFGWPTGLGALLVRRPAQSLLLANKSYFGGGTVAAASATSTFVALRPGTAEALEDGTVSFLAIPSLLPGLRLLRGLRMQRIAQHTTALAVHLHSRLSQLRHYNGAPVCTFYGNWERVASTSGAETPAQRLRRLRHTQGSIVSLNVRQPDGSFVGASEVESVAITRHIQVRTGCVCNPGACQLWLHLSDADVRANLEVIL